VNNLFPYFDCKDTKIFLYLQAERLLNNIKYHAAEGAKALFYFYAAATDMPTWQKANTVISF